VRKPAHFSAGLALAFALGGHALAQENEATPSRAELERADDVLRDRYRPTMHPGEALAIVGLEQAGNDVRSRTPALARSDRVATLVDADEAYERKLAMLENGATYHRPPQPSRAGAESRAQARGRRMATLGEHAAGIDGSWIWASAFGLAIGAILWWMKKRLRLALWR
jgi:hypothetical protein